MANFTKSNRVDEGIMDGLEDFDLIGDFQFTLGVQWDAPDDFKKKVFAAAKSYTLGLKSMDSVYKKYSEYWEIPYSKEKVLINEKVQQIKATIGQAIDNFISINDKPDIPSLYFSLAALFRLQNTFQSVLLCIKSNLYFEASSLSRMIMEQLAWIYRVHKLEIHELINTKPTACIKYLKQLFPYVGRLYSELSESVHLSPRIIPDYVDKDLAIRMGDVKQTTYNLYIMFIMADIFCVVGESVYVNYNLIDTPKYVTTNDGKINLNEDRTSLKDIKNFKTLLNDN